MTTNYERINAVEHLMLAQGHLEQLRYLVCDSFANRLRPDDPAAAATKQIHQMLFNGVEWPAIATDADGNLNLKLLAMRVAKATVDV